MITKLLNFYNMTFDNVVGSESGSEGQGPRGTRQFLDVGCGCGKVTVEVLLPNVPEDVERVVGVDVCENMVSHAREHSSHSKVVYEQLDITGDVSGFLDLYGPFDRLYVFNSLNRVKDQPTAWRNISKLLKPGGECLLFYCAWYATPEIWRALAKRERWSRFSEWWENLIPPSQDMRSTDERLNYVKSLSTAVGLELRSCEVASVSVATEAYYEMMAALIPGSNTLTAEEKRLLLEDANVEWQNWLRGRQNPRMVDNYVIHGIKPMKRQS
ncbi:hypothetical protein HPB50_009579 [Hyalomma asiaticum]|uniref:Uncharacterized protein n=1 Tax=Hyalomma asiaticum TaxID=266040 RepID=A0ACB7RLX2_HYAAI|nr:hypothetical protein HPB50_009579 [Hyalomma asiaticum]